MEFVLLILFGIAILCRSCYNDFKEGTATAERNREYAERKARANAEEKRIARYRAIKESVEIKRDLNTEVASRFVENKDAIASSLTGELIYVYQTDWTQILSNSYCYSAGLIVAKSPWRAVFLIWLAKQGYLVESLYDAYARDFGIKAPKPETLCDINETASNVILDRERQCEFSREICHRVCKVVEMYMREAHPEYDMRIVSLPDTENSGDDERSGRVKWEHDLGWQQEAQYLWDPDEAREEIEASLAKTAR